MQTEFDYQSEIFLMADEKVVYHYHGRILQNYKFLKSTFFFADQFSDIILTNKRICLLKRFDKIKNITKYSLVFNSGYPVTEEYFFFKKEVLNNFLKNHPNFNFDDVKIGFQMSLLLKNLATDKSGIILSYEKIAKNNNKYLTIADTVFLDSLGKYWLSTSK